jgi:cell division protein FtsL
MEEGIGKMLKAADGTAAGRKVSGENVYGAGESAGRRDSVRLENESNTGKTVTEKSAGRTASERSNRKKSGSGGTLKGLVSGTYIAEKLILNNMRYVVMLAVLGIIFISNRFQAERVEREITKLEQEVRDLRAEALSASAQLGSVSRQSEVIDLVKERGLGLQELREPPYRIVVNE